MQMNWQKNIVSINPNMIYIVKSIWIFQHSHAKLNPDINTSLRFPFSLWSPFGCSSPNHLSFQTLSMRTREGGGTLTKCPENQALAYHTGTCSPWAQRAEEWINPTHYIQKNWWGSYIETQFTTLTFQSFKHFTYQPSRPPRAFFWMLSRDASAVIIWGFLCLDMALKTQRDKKKKKKKHSKKECQEE